MHQLLRAILALVLGAGYLPCHAAGSPRLLNQDSLRPVFELLPDPGTGAGQPPETLLSLHLLRDRDTAAIAVAAGYGVSGGGIRMELLTELDFAAHYVLKWTAAAGTRYARYRTPPKPPSVPAAFTVRYPQTGRIPENLLLLQFRFSAPMRPDPDAWTRFHIREDSTGAEDIPFAWRQRCFWLDSDRVLQLMIHPGRVKRGIDYGGPLLRQGRHYILRVDSGLVDFGGNVLGALPPQRFHAGAEDREIPRVEALTRDVTAGTQRPVRIRFSEPMDYSGILSGIRVVSSGGLDIAARVVLTPDGRDCSLIPEQPWTAGAYRVELGSELRDLGANTLRRPFEVRTLREARKDRIPLIYRVQAR